MAAITATVMAALMAAQEVGLARETVVVGAAMEEAEVAVKEGAARSRTQTNWTVAIGTRHELLA